MSEARVKPLEWEEDPRAGWKRGRIVGLSPTAKQEATIFRVESGWQYMGDSYLSAHDSLDAALDRAKAAAQADYEARILAALEPVTVQEARQITDVPPDGTWAVLHPGHYGAFTACALNGGWSMCDDADLRFATHWVPCPFTARALAERGE